MGMKPRGPGCQEVLTSELMRGFRRNCSRTGRVEVGDKVFCKQHAPYQQRMLELRKTWGNK